MSWINALRLLLIYSYNVFFWINLLKVDEKYNCTIICHQQLNNEQETISFSKLPPVLMLKPFYLPAVPRFGIGMLNMHKIWKVAIEFSRFK